MKKTFLTFVIINVLLCLVSCSSVKNQNVTENLEKPDRADLSSMDFFFSDHDLDYDYHSADFKTGKTEDEVLTITQEGTYQVEGDSVSKIVVCASDQEKIQIVFNGATIKCSSGPAIEIQSADKVFLTFSEGTQNHISDNASGYLQNGQTNFDGAIFSKADLTLNGLGALTLEGNYKHAIVSKDDLVLTGLTLSADAKNVGISGKDCVKISDAVIRVNAGSDAIRSDNNQDLNRGYVYIQNSSLNLTAANDGIQAETVLKLSQSDLVIKSGQGSQRTLSNLSESYKGLKASSDIIVESGKIEIDSQDDCIHSNHTISVFDGTLTLKSGDDGIHADTDLSICGGKVEILKSYEALEASKIIITGGKLNLRASDDGLNAAGGNDQSGFGSRPGMGSFSSSNGQIVISGGYLAVNADGDGIDSNGSVFVSGGVTLISGSANGGNSALDYDGEASVSGGVFIALGSSGMAQGFSKAENQGAILVDFATQEANTSIAILDENRVLLASFRPEKRYGCAVISCPEIKQGKNYYIVCSGQVSGADEFGYANNKTISGENEICKIEMTSLIYQAVSQSGMGPGGGGMNPGFQPGKGNRPNFRFS